jgi:hypothetical protein
MYEDTLKWRWIVILVACVLTMAWIEVPAQTGEPVVISPPYGPVVVCVEVMPGQWSCS